MTSKTHRRNFLKSSLGMLAAGQGASVLAASAQRTNPAAQPQQTRNGAARANFFPGFKSMRINTSGATINAVVGGSGPPVIMLHGYPQTHVMWQGGAGGWPSGLPWWPPIYGATATAASLRTVRIIPITPNARWPKTKSKS